MRSSDAPSTASSTTRPAVAPAAWAAAGTAGPGSAGGVDAPRSTTGTAIDATSVVTSSTPLGQVPRRPTCASARARHTAPQMPTATAASVIRRAASASRNGAKPLALSHNTTAPVAAAMKPIHDNTRTLSHPGDSTCTAAIWRSTTSA